MIGQTHPMQHAPFVHLHVHTYYSLLDGAVPIDRLAEVCRKQRLPAVAMTDHGNLFGAVEFYQKLSKEGVKPIIGCESYLLTQGSRKEKKPLGQGTLLSHLVLLVKNKKGYRNLCRLISSSHLEGFYYKPRIDKEILQEHHEGLIALSGCLKGEVANLIMNGRVDDAKDAARYYADLFDGERFYLELMDHGLPDQARVNPVLIEIGKELGIPLVATNDCHYVEASDQEAHEALLCIQTGKVLSDQNRMRFSSDQFYLRSPEEMQELFKDQPEAIANTVAVAERCNYEFDFKTYHFPKFQPPENMDLPTFLTKKVEEGFDRRIPLLKSRHKEEWDANEPTYRDRLTEELEIIKKMGFAGYFLIVYDFIEHAKKQGIAVGPGRGSAAGSLVAYALGITDVDPIPYNLLFERFLNPERISMPDMDIDFCVRKRDKVIEYVTEKYGDVSQIITFGKMKARAVIRDVGRVMSIPYSEVDRIAKMIPATIGITLEAAIQVEPQLKTLAKRDPQIAKLLDVARRLEGFPRHASTHAAGVVISDQPLVNFLPLYRGQNEETISQFDMKAVESIGLIKFDFLGLKTLTLIEDAVRIVKRTRGETVDIESIPLDDEAVYKQLTSGDTKGVFQLESSGMTDLIVRLKPSTFEDVIALVALFRPGPLGSGMVDDFIDRKHGRKQIKYVLPQLEDFLKETYGVIIYQEQVMQIASRLGNFTLGDADILRRAMGKKKPAEMALQREKFVKGCQVNKLSPTKSERIFDLMAEFAGYGFNKSHSAAYALVAYRTAYLKTHYLTEFMAALLTNEMGNTDKILEYMNDCKDHEIKVLPPDVNESVVNFTVIEDKVVRFGLAAIKNVGLGAIESIVETRDAGGPYSSLVEFCQRIDSKRVNRRVLESLIKCGAMDSFGKSRAELMTQLESAMDYGAARQREREATQVSMFDMIDSHSAGETYIERSVDAVEEWTEHQVLTFEKEALGFYLTGHPLAQYEELLSQYTNDTIAAINNLRSKREVRFAGVAAGMREIMTRRGEKMAFVTLEDLTATVETIIFSDVYKNAEHLIKGELPLFFIGTSEVGEESVKVIIKEAYPVQELPTRLTGSVHFHLSAVETSEKQLMQLKAVLAQHPGDCPAYLHLSIPEKSETVMSLPKKLYVAPSLELVKVLEKVFGHNITRFQA